MSIFKTREEYESFKALIGEFVRVELEPISEEITRTRRLPRGLRDILKAKGLHRLYIPLEHGGMGLGFSEYLPILTLVAQSHGSIAITVHAWNTSSIFVRQGREEQRQKYLPLIAKGDWWPGFALTEPDAGTGVDIKATATREGDNYIINGKKHLISFADVAPDFCVVAYTDRALGRNGISAFMVPRNQPGLTITAMPDTMGLEGCVHGVLTFDHCVVPAENVWGKVGQGLDIGLSFLVLSRLGIAARCLGTSQRLMELSIEHAKRRVTFGRAIGRRQAVQQMLAEMGTLIYALQVMIADTAAKADAGADVTKEASMCKLFGIETTRRVSDNALEIYGGIGYTKAFPVERLYRDARALWFEEGTPTIQRLVIARDLLGKIE